MAMFPEGSLDLELLTPLSRNVVIEEFLFPETVILLLQEELRISIPDILQILQKRNVGNDAPHSGIVIDLTASSPLPVIKQEPIDNSGVTSHKGKSRMAFDVDIIDLTMDSDDN